MIRKILVIGGWTILAVSALGIYLFQPDLTPIKNWVASFYSNPIGSISSLNFDGILKQIHQIEPTDKVSAPSPLKASLRGNSSATALSVNGTIAKTNEERAKKGLTALSPNSRLALAASEKIADMFSKQYFEHVSPNGTGPAELATSMGYSYVLVGENLALGNFASDAELVTAWMNSPGHRANILNGRYTEIGVAVKRGYFEGQTVWLAVQEFGKPLSDCPAVSADLKASIQVNQNQIDLLASDLDKRRAELDAYTPKNSPEYGQKVDEYNDLVVKYNKLIEDTKVLISEYNSEVEIFNSCVSG